jgi:GxxExxY protein
VDHAELTKEIIGAAYATINEMGFGFAESDYECCMLVELQRRGLMVQPQLPIEVYFRGAPVGFFVADLLVDDTVIVELKSVRQLIDAYEVQLVNYLTATGKPVGLLINFGADGVEVKRKVGDLPQDCVETSNLILSILSIL